MPMVTRGAVAVLALSAALATALIGCGGDDDERAGPTTIVDVDDTTTTTTTEPATTTTLSEADRFRTLAVELWSARNDLYQNPPADPEAALAEIFDRQCDCFQAELDDLADLAARELHMDGSPATPLGAQFAEFDSASRTAAVFLALDATSRRLLNSDGSTQEEIAGDDPYAITLGIALRQDVWVIDAVVVLQVDAPYVDELIQSGLP